MLGRNQSREGWEKCIIQRKEQIHRPEIGKRMKKAALELRHSRKAEYAVSLGTSTLARAPISWTLVLAVGLIRVQ